MRQRPPQTLKIHLLKLNLTCDISFVDLDIPENVTEIRSFFSGNNWTNDINIFSKSFLYSHNG